MNRRIFMNAKSTQWLAAIIFTIVGAIFLIVGPIIFANEMSFKNKGIESIAIITDIETYHSTDDTYYKVYVQYIANDRTYNNTLDYWDSTMSVGKEVKIYYNPDNPNEIVANNSSYLLLLLPLIGGVSFILGTSMIIVNIKRKRRKSKLLENGDYINAEIEEVIYDTSYSVNRISPHVIVCKWENPADGNTYVFKSENIWYDPEPIIEEKNIITLPVYINRDNLKKYFVSLENIEE